MAAPATSAIGTGLGICLLDDTLNGDEMRCRYDEGGNRRWRVGHARRCGDDDDSDSVAPRRIAATRRRLRAMAWCAGDGMASARDTHLSRNDNAPPGRCSTPPPSQAWYDGVVMFHDACRRRRQDAARGGLTAQLAMPLARVARRKAGNGVKSIMASRGAAAFRRLACTVVDIGQTAFHDAILLLQAPAHVAV